MNWYWLTILSTVVVAGCGETPTSDQSAAEPAPVAPAVPTARPPVVASVPEKPATTPSGLNGVGVDPRITNAYPDLPAPVDPGVPIQLSYKPTVGDVWRYRLTNTMHQDVMGMSTSQQSELHTKFRFTSVSDNMLEMLSVLETLVVELKTPGGDLVINSLDPSKERAAPPFRGLLKIWREILKCQPTFQIEPSGHIHNFGIPPEIQRVIEANSENQASMNAEAYVANFFAGIFQLSKAPVSVGDQWETVSYVELVPTRNKAEKGTFLGTAEVAGRKVAMIEFTSITSEPDDVPRIEEFNSDSVHLVLFDLEAGQLWRSYAVTQLDAVMVVNDMDLQQVTELKSTIELMDE